MLMVRKRKPKRPTLSFVNCRGCQKLSKTLTGYCLQCGPIERAYERFLAKVNKSTLTGCWEWTSPPTNEGYGLFWYKRKNMTAHRFSWGFHFGAVPDGLNVLHQCDNRICVRPDHLFLGTLSENSQDCMAKGRKKGSKITFTLAREIRQRHADGGDPRTLAKEYGIHSTTMYALLRRKTWKLA